MAKIQPHPLNNRRVIIPELVDDTLQDIFERGIETFNAPKNVDMKEYFDIYINGGRVDKNFWKHIKPKNGVDILIVVTPRGGNFGQFARIAAIVAVTAIAPQVGGYIAGSSTGLAFGFATAGVGIAGVLAVNALIPVPTNSQRSVGYSSYSDSQMFAVASQSNQVSKYGNVHKVYGSFRNFPKVVGAPYTVVETDPSTGQKAQFLYAVYDFGLGPMLVDNIKIGETDISEYSSVSYRLVDPNKPSVSEGVWDDILFDDFTIYKGDVNRESLALSLNRSTQGTPVIRNASTNTNNVKQEVFLNFVAPQGLYTVNTGGGFEARTVELKVEFAEVGTNDWRLFDDFDYVESINERTFRGNYLTYDPTKHTTIDIIDDEKFYDPWKNNLNAPANGDAGDIIKMVYFQWVAGGQPTLTPDSDYSYTVTTYGIKKGEPFTLWLNSLLPLDTEFSIEGNSIGYATSVGAASGGYYPYTFDAINRSYWLYFRIKREKTTGTPEPDEYYTVTRSGSSRVLEIVPNGRFVMSRSTQKPYYASLSFTPFSKEDLKIRVTRITSYGGASYQIIDDVTWTALNVRFQQTITNTTKRHVFLELKIKGTDQLNGTVDTLNAETTSVLDVYDDISETWSKQATSNPAWVYADLLTGEINKRALEKTKLDVDSLVEWANYCDVIPTAPASFTPGFVQPRFTCNFALDYAITLKSILQQVATAAQASFNVTNGKYGVLIDKAKTTPVQIFTPRNSSNFRSNRKYTELPHAFKVMFIDPTANWERKEVLAYADGYDSSTATVFEELEAFACTNYEQAYRYGRYMLAQATLRQENITIDVDFEHLVCTRGDYVMITQDVMQVGGTPARVTAVAGSDITIDESFTTIPLTDYGYTFRANDGTITTSTMTVTGSQTATVDGTVPSVGNLIVWGVVDEITYDCIVKEISPNADLTATLTLVEKNNAIFDAESSGTIADYSPGISTVLDSELSAPGLVTNLAIDDETYDCVNQQYEYFVDLTWDAPEDTVYELFEVYVSVDGKAHQLYDTTRNDFFHYIVSEEDLDLSHDFKVLAVNARGVKRKLQEATSITTTPASKTTAPSNVDGLFINVTNETMQLDWEPITDCDVDFYQIRYSASLTATWDSSIPLMNVAPNQSMVFTQSRTGSYFLKAFDWAGNESETAAIARTAIPNLVNLNIIEETNDFPTFPGELEKIDILPDNSIILQEQISSTDPTEVAYYSEGEYRYEGFLDLGEIYTCRIQSLVEAEGYSPTDLMSNWTLLSEVDPLATSGLGSLWDVQTYYRGTNSFNVMSEWLTLSSIDPISEGNQDNFTDWRKFTIGDFTARIFQFKLVLKSYQANISPRVYDATIKSDMPDRVESFNNITVPNTGYSFSYSAEYKGPGSSPVVQITQDNAQQGDYYVLSNKTLSGFDIDIYDKNDIQVERQIDVFVKGYGKKHTAVL